MTTPNNNGYEHPFDIRYKGLKLIPSKSAMSEMNYLGLMLYDCKIMLEEGYAAPRKRAEDCEEKWFNKRNKTFNIVIVKSFNYFYNEEVYLITHVGCFGIK
ncbi:MAG: hypothetical protein AABX39_04400 [Nanoarchaeota archaeon]